MARPCSICSDSAKIATASRMVAEGETDAAIGAALGVNRMAAARHRLNHLLAPAQAIAAAAGKDQPAVQRRQEIMAAAEAGDPAAFVGFSAIIADLQKVSARLERTADAAEVDGARMSVAGLSAQQLRAAEVRAKLGQVGGFAARAVEGPTQVPVQINISFAGAGTVESVTLAAQQPPRVQPDDTAADYSD